MGKITEKNISGALRWLAAAAVLCLAAAYVPPLVLLAPVLIAYMAARFGPSGGVAAVGALGIAGVFSPAAAGAAALMSLPVALVAVRVVRGRVRFLSGALALGTAALCGLALAFCLIWLLRGMTPAEFIVSRVSGALSRLSDAQVNLIYQGARIMDIQTGAVTAQAVLAASRADAVAEMLSSAREWANYLFVPGALCYSLLSGLLCFVISRRGAKTAGFRVAAIPEFSDYELPRGLWAAFLVSWIAAYAGDSLGATRSGLLEPTILIVYGFVFIVQALSFADFLFKARGMKKGARIAVHIALVLLFGTLLMWVGVFENIVRFRKRSQEKGGEEF